MDRDEERSPIDPRTEYARNRFRCVGCGERVPVERVRAGHEVRARCAAHWRPRAMAVTRDPPARRELAAMPEFDLTCLFDDPSDPSEVTVFSPETDRPATEWLTVDRSTAVALESVR